MNFLVVKSFSKLTKVHFSDGGKMLCDTCAKCQKMRGGAEGEELMLCAVSYYRPIKIPFKIVECNEYVERGEHLLPTCER